MRSGLREVTKRFGFSLILVLTAVACIFEQSDYKGGGRIGRGADTGASTGSSVPDEDDFPQIPSGSTDAGTDG